MATATPAFAWANPNSKIPKKPAHKPLVNPLLKRAPRTSVTQQPQESRDVSSSFGGAQTELRQRKQPPSPQASNVPPRLSLTNFSASSVPRTSIARSEPDNGNNVLALMNHPHQVLASPREEDNDNDCWVLVYGFSSNDQYNEVLRRFGSYGNIESVRGGKSNWVAIKYGSSIEVERAICQQPCILGNNVLVGVARMDDRLGESLDWTVTPTFSYKPPESTDEMDDHHNGLREADILIAGKRTLPSEKGICERFLSFLFGWDDY